MNELFEALQTLLDAVEGNHVTVGDCNQAKAAIERHMELAARKRADEDADEIYENLRGAQRKLQGYELGGSVWDEKAQAFRAPTVCKRTA